MDLRAVVPRLNNVPLNAPEHVPMAGASSHYASLLRVAGLTEELKAVLNARQQILRGLGSSSTSSVSGAPVLTYGSNAPGQVRPALESLCGPSFTAAQSGAGGMLAKVPTAMTAGGAAGTRISGMTMHDGASTQGLPASTYVDQNDSCVAMYHSLLTGGGLASTALKRDLGSAELVSAKRARLG
jgi:hypothetical protein